MVLHSMYYEAGAGPINQSTGAKHPRTFNLRFSSLRTLVAQAAGYMGARFVTRA